MQKDLIFGEQLFLRLSKKFGKKFIIELFLKIHTNIRVITDDDVFRNYRKTA